MRHAILVVGMHRSGTSAFTGAMIRAGVAAPVHLMPPNSDNERGFFESVAFQELHDKLLQSAGSIWFDWRPFPTDWTLSESAGQFRSEAIRLLSVEFGDAPVFVLKDPRICRLVAFWRSILQEAGIKAHAAIPFRSPSEVSQSLCERNGLAVEHGLLLWLRHVLDAERDTRGLPRAFVPMEDLLSDWRPVLARASTQMRIKWPAIDPIAIDDFLSADLKHHEEAPIGAAAEWTERVHYALHGLARDPRSRLAQSALDAVAGEFEQACQLFGPLTAGLEAERNAARAEAARYRDLQPAGPPANAAQPAGADDPDASWRILRGESVELRDRLEALRAQVAGARAPARASRLRRAT